MRGSSASSVSLTSATIASPIGARAASSGSLVIAMSGRPRAAAAREVRVVGEHRRAGDEDQVVARERLGHGADRGGSTPWKCGWPSGKPIRPPPVAGAAQTGSRAFSASATRRPSRRSRRRPGRRRDRVRGGGEPLRESRARAPGRRPRGRSTVRACGGAPRRRRPPRASRPSGSRRTPGPSAAARPGGSRARARAGRPRRAAARSSTSRAGAASALRRGWSAAPAASSASAPAGRR